MSRVTFRPARRRPATMKAALALSCALTAAAALRADTFTNPISPSGADPWVVQYKGQYFYARSDGGQLFVDRATDLQDIGHGTVQQIYKPPTGTPYSQDLWAPELHFIDNHWYVYFAADDGNNADHRMYVLESTSADPQGTYTFKGKIAAATDRFAIDGTVVPYGGSNYFVWSGWPGTTDGQQNLYIAQMSNPWTISGDRSLIATPTYDWEKQGLAINEGPEALVKNGTLNVIYSASGFWTNDYALGQITLTGTNPMSAASWTKKSTPVFSKTANVVGVGHASFVKSPDQGQDWIVYHAHDNPTVWTGNRDVRTQQFSWNADNTPNFGSPVDSGVPIQTPSGRAAVTFIPNYSFERGDVSASGIGFGIDKLSSTGTVGVVVNNGRFFTPIAGAEGNQVGFLGTSGVNAVWCDVGDIVKSGDYQFSAGLAIASNQLSTATAAPTTYQVRIESVGRKPDGTPNESDKVLLGTTTVNTTSLNTASFSFSTSSANIPLLSDRYNTILRVGVYSSGVGGGNWQAKIENLGLNFTPAAPPATPAPAAYWRFEEGPAGGGLTGANGDNALPHTTTADSAPGGANPLRTYANSTSPHYSTDVPAAVVPNTGAVNSYSMDFAPNQDLYTELPGTLTSKVFSAFTIEASFKLNTLDLWQCVVGKDGKPTPMSIAPIEFKQRDDDHRLQIEIIDGAGNERHVSSVDPLTVGQWFNAAAVNTGTTLALYLDRGDGAGYVLQGTTPITGGALFNSAGNWTVGRGMYNGSPTDWVDGKIDEVRVTDSALASTQFLFFDPAGAPSWNVDASGPWTTQSNWSRALPDSINAVANFTDAITAPRTVSLDSPRTVAAVNFRNANGYTISGGGSLTIDTNGSAGAITVDRGSHTIAVPITFNRDTTLTVTPPASMLTLAGDMAASPGVVLTKAGVGTLQVKHLRAGSISITAGQVRVLSDGTPAGTSRLGTLSIAPQAKLDLADNDLVIDYTGASPAETIRQYLRAGRNGGNWAGTTGITSSAAAADPGHRTTIGYLDNAQLGVAAFSGQTVDASSLLLKYTWYGDANLDGRVDADDYALLDRGFRQSLTGWGNGDFNYDGVVDAADYLLIDSIRVAQTGVLDPTLLAARAAQFGDGYVLELIATVPDPSSALLAPSALLVGLSSTRRYRP